MTTALFSRYLREVLREDGEFILYRAWPAGQESEGKVLLEALDFADLHSYVLILAAYIPILTMFSMVFLKKQGA